MAVLDKNEVCSCSFFWGKCCSVTCNDLNVDLEYLTKKMFLARFFDKSWRVRGWQNKLRSGNFFDFLHIDLFSCQGFRIPDCYCVILSKTLFPCFPFLWVFEPLLESLVLLRNLYFFGSSWCKTLECRQFHNRFLGITSEVEILHIFSFVCVVVCRSLPVCPRVCVCVCVYVWRGRNHTMRLCLLLRCRASSPKVPSQACVCRCPCYVLQFVWSLLV